MFPYRDFYPGQPPQQSQQQRQQQQQPDQQQPPVPPQTGGGQPAPALAMVNNPWVNAPPTSAAPYPHAFWSSAAPPSQAQPTQQQPPQQIFLSQPLPQPPQSQVFWRGAGGHLAGVSLSGAPPSQPDAFAAFANPSFSQADAPLSRMVSYPSPNAAVFPTLMESKLKLSNANPASSPPLPSPTRTPPLGPPASASTLSSVVNAPQFVPKTTGGNAGGGATSPGPGSPQPGRLTSMAQPFEPGGGSSTPKLGASAQPFIPGVARSKSVGEAPSAVTRSKSGGDGMSTQAPVFQPKSGLVAGPQHGEGGIADTQGGQGGATGGLVPVVQGETVYYLPEDEEGYEEDLGEYYGTEIFDWSLGASSLAAPPRRTVQMMGLSEPLRQLFLLKDLDRLRALPPDDERLKEIPPKFHLVYPLDDENKPRGTAGAFGYPSVVYKVVSHEDGNTYALRRFDNVRTTPKIVSLAVQSWRRISHPNIVRLSKAFIQHGALFFIHEYHPCAQTLMQRYISTGHTRGQQRLPEKLLWSFVTQILAAIRAVHAAGSACRMIHPNYILLTTGNRVRLSCPGVVDVLESETRKSITDLQKEDMFCLGKLLVMLATRTLLSPQTFNNALSVIAQSYSQDIHTLAVTLCSTKPPTAYDLSAALSRHIMDELDSAYGAADALESHLANEYESGRLFRLSLKLNQVLEKPEHLMDPTWAETGERYVLKLFRDYVFHQVDEEGNPVMDFGHIVHSLNKLDMGDPEKILLMSRDQHTIIVVSYEDVKRALEAAYVELVASANIDPTINELAPVPGEDRSPDRPRHVHHHHHHHNQPHHHHAQHHYQPKVDHAPGVRRYQTS